LICVGEAPAVINLTAP